jgi:hypothetical protein
VHFLDAASLLHLVPVPTHSTAEKYPSNGSKIKAAGHGHDALVRSGASRDVGNGIIFGIMRDDRSLPSIPIYQEYVSGGESMGGEVQSRRVPALASVIASGPTLDIISPVSREKSPDRSWTTPRITSMRRGLARSQRTLQTNRLV